MNSADLTTDTPDIPVNDLVMAKNMADDLHKAYPGHLWAVSVDGKQGVATIRNMALDGAWGFYLNLPKIAWSAASLTREVRRLGGELLERYRVHRGKADAEELAYLPVNRAGLHMPDRG